MQKIDLTNINLSGQGGGGEGSSVQWTQKVHEGTNIAEINIDGTTTQVYAPEAQAGSTVQWTQEVQEGTEIATIEIDGNITTVYAPEGGAGDVTAADLEADEEVIASSLNDLQTTIEDVSTRMSTETVNSAVYEMDSLAISAAINQLIRDKVQSVSTNAALWIGTQAEYDALTEYSETTLYAIKTTE